MRPSVQRPSVHLLWFLLLATNCCRPDDSGNAVVTGGRGPRGAPEALAGDDKDPAPIQESRSRDVGTEPFEPGELSTLTLPRRPAAEDVPVRRHDLASPMEADGRSTVFECVGSDAELDGEWARVVRSTLRREFVPPESSESAFVDQSVEVLVRRLDMDGQIGKFDVVTLSKNSDFNTAVLNLLRRFVPAEGGELALPVPPHEVQEYVNRNGMVLVLDGRLLRDEP